MTRNIGRGTPITKPSILIIAIVLFSNIMLMNTAYAPSVGVIPSDVDLGAVSRGTEVTGTIYLSTSSGSSVSIMGGYITPVSNPWFSKYISEYSEEDISGWIEFPDEPVTVDGSKSFEVTVAGTTTRANTQMDFTIKIPKNAEPGYHVGSINFNPVTIPGKGPEVTMFAFARPNYVFRVNGEVTRKAEIARIEAQRTAQNEVYIYIYLQNTGTNTISTLATQSIIKVYDSNNEIKSERTVGSITLKPGEMQKMDVRWYSRDEIKDGRYKVVADIGYRSGSAQKTEFVTVPSMITKLEVQADAIEVITEPEDAIPVGRTCSINWTYVIILALIIALVAYTKSRDGTIKTAATAFAISVIGLALANWILCAFGNTGIIIVILLAGLAYYIKK